MEVQQGCNSLTFLNGRKVRCSLAGRALFSRQAERAWHIKRALTLHEPATLAAFRKRTGHNRNWAVATMQRGVGPRKHTVVHTTSTGSDQVEPSCSELTLCVLYEVNFSLAVTEIIESPVALS